MNKVSGLRMMKLEASFGATLGSPRLHEVHALRVRPVAPTGRGGVGDLPGNKIASARM